MIHNGIQSFQLFSDKILVRIDNMKISYVLMRISYENVRISYVIIIISYKNVRISYKNVT